MQFKYPEILYFLFLLIIPVIIHLFQLQKFEKVAFTNVKLLKEIKQQTRKSSRLKKILLLMSRLFLMASLILAFAQPYFNKKNYIKNKKTYIYLDNSFSMQAKGEKGELLQRAKNDLLDQLSKNPNDFLIITNDHVYKDNQDRNDLMQIDYHSEKKDLKKVLLQIENLRNKEKEKSANIVLISDFQKNTSDLNGLRLDSLSNYYFVQILPVQKGNISIDSVWIDDKDHKNIQVNVKVKSYEMAVENLSVSLFVNDNLFGKTTVLLERNNSKIINFIIPDTGEFYAKITLNDNRLKFDNTLYFNSIKKEKLPVLAIGENNRFLSKLYTDGEFAFTTASLSTLDYSLFSRQKLIILNEIPSFSNTLIQSLKNFKGNLVVIPSNDCDIKSYNELLNSFQIGKMENVMRLRRYVSKINYNHPFFKNVFEKKTENYQYPVIEQLYPTHFFRGTSLLNLSDGQAFLVEIKKDDRKIYWFNAPLNSINTNFVQSPLVVPVFYNFSLKNTSRKEMYFIIGNKNEIQFKSNQKGDAVFHLVKKDFDFIPLQTRSMGYIKIQTDDKPFEAGIYKLTNSLNSFIDVSFNYNRKESDLTYYQVDKHLKNKQNTRFYKTVNNVIEQINDQNKNRNLWQLFIIFALIFFGVEILLQKFLKN